MSNSLVRKASRTELSSLRLSAIDRLLAAGMKLGPKGKRNAVNKVLEKIPQWTRGDCWQRMRKLRRTPELAVLAVREPCAGGDQQTKPRSASRMPSHPWTPADDDRLLNWAGYEPVKKIAQRLGRSESAVRFRMGALGMSAKVRDGFSLRSLRKMLRVSPTRLRNLIGSGRLRVRDARITAASFAAFIERQGESLNPAAFARIAAVREKGDEAYSWDRVADVLCLDVERIQNLISSGQLKVADPFVTERQFEEFCRKHGDELNFALIDPETATWLDGYGVARSNVKRGAVSRARKHALVIRVCECGREIAGNAFFRHVKACRRGASESVGGESRGNYGAQLLAS